MVCFVACDIWFESIVATFAAMAFPSFLCFVIAWMFSRGSNLPSSSNQCPAESLKDDITDLFADNRISAKRTTVMLGKASKAGVKVPKKLTKTKGKNQARALTRHKLKRTKWPDYYYFECRVWDRKGNREVTVEIPVVLPSEVLEVLWKASRSKDDLLGEHHFDSGTKAHVAHMKSELGVSELFCWGVHGDGVPCNYDRTESVAITSLNLPGLPGSNGRMRVPICILPEWCMGDNTMDDINAVFAWDMRHSLAGARPTCRHDGSAWLPTDKERNKRMTVPVPIRTCLCQIRADWDWMGHVFHFPFHSVKAGVCWQCKCKKKDVRFIIVKISMRLCMWLYDHIDIHQHHVATVLPHRNVYIYICGHEAPMQYNVHRNVHMRVSVVFQHSLFNFTRSVKLTTMHIGEPRG